MKLIGTAIDQKPTGDDGSHRSGCCTAMWKGRRNHHIMISKQQPKYYMNPSGTKFSGETYLCPTPIDFTKNSFTVEISSALPLSCDSALVRAGLRSGPAGQLPVAPIFNP